MRSIALLDCICNTTPTGDALPESEENLLDGLEEVNLLAGLAAGTHFILNT